MSKYTINVSFQTRVNKTTRTLEIAESFGLGLDEKEWTLYDNLELEVKQGDVVYITGQSGSGKSVVLRELQRQMKDEGLSVLHRQIFRQASWPYSTAKINHGVSLKTTGVKRSMTWNQGTRCLFLNLGHYRKMSPGYHRMGNIRSGTAHPGRRMRKQKNCFRYGKRKKQKKV